jgi:hypothetical protein
MVPADLRDDPLLAALVDYWERKRGERAMPRRRDIDPLDMPRPLLPHLELVEFGDGGRPRYRLVGTAIVDAMGRDMTGRFLDTVLVGEHAAFVDRLHRAAQTACRPVYGLCWLRIGEGRGLSIRRLVTPLSEDGATVTMTLGATRLGNGEVGRGTLLAATITGGTIEVL